RTASAPAPTSPPTTSTPRSPGYWPRTPPAPRRRCRRWRDIDGRLAAGRDLAARRREGAPHMKNLASLRVKIYADGADRAGMLRLAADPLIQGFTTNPTLMRKAGVADYEAFARDVVAAIPDRPISFEVFSDDFDEMEQQATQIAEWGPNIYVKVPV